MELIFEKVLERDIDLLMINKFVTDKKILELFLKKINKQGYKVFNIQHSLMDQEDGESDITVIVEKDNHKIGLLIEDKIDAIAMPNQRNRYNARGRKGIDNNQYDEFFVFMIAPNDYLKSNSEAQLYENQISYEELKNYFTNDLYATALIDKALEEKKNGYTIIENPNVTLFWEQYYTLIRQGFPDIKINEVHGPRGNNARWPELTTYYPNIKIIQKSDRGFLDLTFSKMGNYPNVFHKYLDEKLEKDMYIEKTGKSMAVRIIIPIIDFGSSFDSQLENVKESLKQSLRLYKLLNMIDINSMYLEIENKNAEIKSISDFAKIYPSGIIVNYDLRVTYRCSTEKPEIIGNIVDYPYVQRYQTGVNPRTTLFMIKDNTLYRLVRLEINNPDSNYYIEDVKESIAESFYEDKEFLNNPNPPVNVFSEELLEIIDKEGQV